MFFKACKNDLRFFIIMRMTLAIKRISSKVNKKPRKITWEPNSLISNKEYNDNNS